MSGQWLPAAVGAFLIGMVLYGHFRGFVSQCVSIGALLATTILSRIGSPLIANYLSRHTPIRGAVEEAVMKILDAGTFSFAQNLAPSDQRLAIEGLPIPQVMKSLLVENNNSEIYHLLGVDHFADYLSTYISGLIISAVTSVVLFFVTFVVIRVVMSWLNVFTHLPLIHGLNKLAGAGIGLVHGLLIVWIGGVVLSLCSGTQIGAQLLSQVEASGWLSFLYQYNILEMLLQGVLHSFLL